MPALVSETRPELEARGEERDDYGKLGNPLEEFGILDWIETGDVKTEGTKNDADRQVNEGSSDGEALKRSVETGDPQ